MSENDVPGQPVDTNALLDAERTLSGLSDLMARECQDQMREWTRGEMRRHAEARAALLAVRSLLIDRASNPKDGQRLAGGNDNG